MQEIIRGKAEWAYVAGIIDGEGCIGMYKLKPRKSHRWTTPRYYLSVCVINRSYPLMEWLKEIFGGKVSARKKGKAHHNQAWRWLLSSSEIEVFLKGILPHLIVKRNQAELALRYIEENPDGRNGTGKPCPDWIVELREGYWRAFHELNERPLPPAETKRGDIPLG